MAETNQLKVGNENILYVDLTRKPEDYKKVAEIQKETTKNIENNKQQINIEKNDILPITENKVKEDNKKEKIDNTYETKTIIVKTPDITSIENYGNVQSIVKVSSNIYCIKYTYTC